MIYAKALLTNALLFGLLTASLALPAPQDNSHPNDAQETAQVIGRNRQRGKEK